MKKTKEQRILLAAVLMVAGLAAFILYGRTGLTAGADAGPQPSPAQVRMEVDTTVISGDTEGLIPPEAPAEPGLPDAAQPGPAGETAVPDEARSGPAGTAVPTPKAQAPKAPTPKAPAQQSPPQQTSAQKPAASGTVTKASLKATSDSFVLTIVCDRPAGETAHFTLSSPGRLVLDMSGSWRLTAPNVIRAGSGPVAHVVIGAHPDKMRFVVHFRDTAGVRTGTPVMTRNGSTLRMTVPFVR